MEQHGEDHRIQYLNKRIHQGGRTNYTQQGDHSYTYFDEETNEKIKYTSSTQPEDKNGTQDWTAIPHYLDFHIAIT